MAGWLLLIAPKTTQPPAMGDRKRNGFADAIVERKSLFLVQVCEVAILAAVGAFREIQQGSRPYLRAKQLLMPLFGFPSMALKSMVENGP